MTITDPITIHLAIFAFSLGAFALQVHAEEPGPEKDYGRTGLRGLRGNIEWESLLHGDGLEGWKATGPEEDAWSRDGDTIVSKTGDEGHATRLVYKDQTWKNYELKVQATFVKGSNLINPFRISED